jgi:hypothetical protein
LYARPPPFRSAVAFALTPGLPPIEHVTIRPRGGTITRILFVRQDFAKDGGSWHMLGTPGNESNAVPPLERPLTPLEKACALLTPLYASRCARGESSSRLLLLHLPLPCMPFARRCCIQVAPDEPCCEPGEFLSAPCAEEQATLYVWTSEAWLACPPLFLLCCRSA